MSSLAALVKEVEVREEKNQLDEVFLSDVIKGFSKAQKTLPCKYFYDERGSQLFEKICETPEYYVTRTECSIYETHGDDMAETIGERALIVEPGAGSVKKIALLLEHLNNPAGFIPMDISPEILQSSSDSLSAMFPEVDIRPMVADFLNAEALGLFFSKLPNLPLVNKRVVFFPGSTIGNFHPDEAENFLKQFKDNLHSGDGMLIGVDLVKNHETLEAAYNDKAEITANFNLNLLHRLQNELNASINVEDFSHKAVFNSQASRIEMHLVSETHQHIHLEDNSFTFTENETIHTECSYKYTQEDFQNLARKAGFEPRALWKDEQDLFSVHYLEVN